MPNRPVSGLVRSHITPESAYVPVVSGRKGADVIRLGWNESPFGLSPKAQQVLESFTEANRYPEFDQASLRAQLGDYIGVSPDRIIPGAGLDDVFATLAMLLIEPGDEVVIAEPTFGMYRSLFSLHGANIVNVPLGPAPDWALDAAGIVNAVTERTKLIMLCNPNNPTGTPYDPATIEQIVQQAPCIVGIDEAYAEFSGIDHLDLANRYDNVVVFRTLSKFAGLAGLRVGYGIFPETLLPYLSRVVPAFFNISLLSSHVAIASLDDLDHLRANTALLIDERERLRTRLNELPGVTAYPSATNFVLFSLPIADSTEVVDELGRRNVIVRRFGNPDHGMQHCIRVSIGVPNENEIFFNQLGEVMEQLRVATGVGAS